MIKVNRDKNSIVSYIERNGPSLPIHLAKAANLPVLFTSAFLSELRNEGKVLFSHLKIGSSSLYYINGQEQQLENFIEYLNPKEKEAFNLLKKEKILLDEQQVPAIRVALREINDFALPLTIFQDGTEKKAWRYYLIQEAEAKNLLENKKREKQKDNKPQEKKKDPEEKMKEESSLQSSHQLKLNKDTSTVPFLQQVKEKLSEKNLEILSLHLEKKKELMAVVRGDSPLGKQEYFLIAKDKKKINEQELEQALQKAHQENMPILLLLPGEPDKKATSKSIALRNLVKIIRL